MIVFRADGNKQIGVGHIMRCLSVADALRKIGKESIFLLAGNDMKSLIETRGYQAIILGTDYTAMDQETEVLADNLEELKTELIIIDSYYVTAGYLEFLRNYALTVYFDDLTLFPYPVDYLINYNIYANQLLYEELYRNQKKPKFFLTPLYTPLREQFVNIPSCRRDDVCKEILFSAGGADPAHVTKQFLDYLKGNEKVLDRKYHIVLGSVNPDKEEILQFGKELACVEIHEAVADMKSLICQCDMAISASGTTLYELCACGIPTVTYILADNQIMVSNTFDRLGYMVSVGDVRKSENLGEEIYLAMNRLAYDTKKRITMSKRMRELVDGKGAERLARMLVDGV